MKSNFFLSLVITGFLIPSFCVASHNATHPTATSQKSDVKKDGEVLAIVIAIDKNEIADAKEALRRTKNPAVKRYAHMLKKQHKANLKDALMLSKKMGIPLVQSAKSTTLQNDGKNELMALTKVDNKKFDKTYINDMVKGHTAALKLINNNLLKNATNAEVKNFIEATRPHIVQHLHDGQTIQKELK